MLNINGKRQIFTTKTFNMSYNFKILILFSVLSIFNSCSSNDESGETNNLYDTVLPVNFEDSGLYVENDIDYGGVIYVRDNGSISFSPGYKYKFGVNNLDFKYLYSNTYFNPYQLNQEALDFLYQQNNAPNESDRIHINGDFSFDESQELMLWGDYEFTRPILVQEDFFGNEIIMFPLKKTSGQENVLDGIYETILKYPDGDVVKSVLEIDYQEDNYIYINGKILLNGNAITETVFTPINADNSPTFKVYNIQNSVYLVPFGLIQYQPIFSIHFFVKDVYM